MMFVGVLIIALSVNVQGTYLDTEERGLDTEERDSGEISLREALGLYVEREMDGRGVVKETKVDRRGLERRSTAPTDAEMKADYLASHIRHRREVSPTASNMLHVKWSTELQKVAQGWADTCKWSHNPDRSSDSPSFGYVGENKYLRTGNVNVNRSVDYWMLERSKYNFDTQECSSGICTHYTQVVWHNSEYIGCGVNFCTSMVGLSGWNNVYFHVCNYGPGGNYVGQDPYSTGTSCSACPTEDPSCCKDNQCLMATET